MTGCCMGWRYRIAGAGATLPRWLYAADWQPTAIELTALMVGVALALRAFSFNVTGLDWDESLYIVIAQRWLHGGIPYIAVWDQHPMGLPAVFAAVTWILGNGLLAARLAAFAAVTATAVLLTLLLLRHVGDRTAALLAGLLYLFVMGRPEGLAANTEVFNSAVVSAASLLLLGEFLRPGAQTRTSRVFAAALLFGVGLQIKYVVFPEAALLCSAVLVHAWNGGMRWWRVLRLACFAVAGGLLPTALATGYFWWAGALPAYLDANIRANTAYVDLAPTTDTVLMRLRFGLVPLIALLPWPLLLLWLTRRSAVRHRAERVVYWLLLWLLATCIDVALPMKFWKHYFNALLPPLCLIAALSVVLLARRFPRWEQWIIAGLAAVIVTPAVALMIKHFDDSRTIAHANVPHAIASQIARHGSDGRDVYVFNYDPLVYAYANAVPPTRFVLGIELSGFSASSGARSAAVVGCILSHRPRWIVIADPSPYAFTPAIHAMLSEALTDYRLASMHVESDYVGPPFVVRLYRAGGAADGGGTQSECHKNDPGAPPGG